METIRDFETSDFFWLDFDADIFDYWTIVVSGSADWTQRAITESVWTRR